jgi:hypothetical protein
VIIEPSDYFKPFFECRPENGPTIASQLELAKREAEDLGSIERHVFYVPAWLFAVLEILSEGHEIKYRGIPIMCSKDDDLKIRFRQP